MAAVRIHVVQLAPEDWVVRKDDRREPGHFRELGHYASRDAAIIVGRKVAAKDRAKLIIHDQAGKTRSERPAKSWLATLFGR